MSQHRQALELIEKKSGLEGLLLRPLSAKLLPETIPEKNSWVKRDKLLNIGGRSRRPQMALAQKFGMEDYPNASGGCLLTDPRFSERLKELMEELPKAIGGRSLKTTPNPMTSPFSLNSGELDS